MINMINSLLDKIDPARREKRYAADRAAEAAAQKAYYTGLENDRREAIFDGKVLAFKAIRLIPFCYSVQQQQALTAYAAWVDEMAELFRELSPRTFRDYMRNEFDWDYAKFIVAEIEDAAAILID